MKIETGSQNLSRIPGRYVYPAPEYKSHPVESVAAIDRYKNLSVFFDEHSGLPKGSRTFSLYTPGGLRANGNLPGQWVDLFV